MSSKPNYYELLGLPVDALPEEIRRAYKETARKLHPDVNPDPLAAEQFIQAQKAYEVLQDSIARKAYDRKLVEENQDPVIIHTIYSRPSVTIMNEPQLLYTLLDFSIAKQLVDRPSPPLNICLVLDRSTSMQGARMDTVKAAAIELIRQLRSNDQLSVVVFSDRADVLHSADQRSDRSAIENKIKMIHPSGGTEMYQGLEAGYNEISRFSNQTIVSHLILITDGRTYGDEELCLRLAEKAAIQGIRFTGLGIGTEWNDIFLEELTTRTGGSSYYISRTGDINSFLRDKFNYLSSILAERVNLNLKSAPGVQLNSIFRLQPEPSMLPVNPTIPLGSILKDVHLSILLEFQISSVSEGPLRIPVAAGDISLLLASDPYHPYSLTTSISRPIAAEIEEEPPPKPIFQALSQITLYRMQERARKDIAEGKAQDASMRLQRLATQLFSMGEVELAKTASIEAERIQQTQMLSAEGEKAIKYGTRAFLLPAHVQENWST